MARKIAIITPEVVAAIDGVLRTAPLPLTAAAVSKALKGPLKRPGPQLDDSLRQQAAAGAIRLFSPVKNQFRYGDRPIEIYAQAVLQAEIQKSKTPQDGPKLLKKLQKPFPELTPGEFERILNAELAAGRVFRHPPPTGKDLRKFKYSPRPPVLDVYLKKAVKELQAVFARVEPAGIDRTQVAEALARLVGLRSTADALPGPAEVPDVAERILAAIPRVEPAALSGALVFFRDLRRELPDVGKAEFDEAVLALNHTRSDLALHIHDHAALLSAGDKESLVAGPEGRFYIGVAFRR